MLDLLSGIRPQILLQITLHRLPPPPPPPHPPQQPEVHENSPSSIPGELVNPVSFELRQRTGGRLEREREGAEEGGRRGESCLSKPWNVLLEINRTASL